MPFLIISCFLHIIIIFFLSSYFKKNELELNFQDRSINIEIGKMKKNEIKKLYKLKKSKIGEVKNIQGYKGFVKEKKIDQTVDFVIDESKYSFNNENLEAKIFKYEKKNLFKNEDFSKYTKKEIESLYKNDGLLFLDGEKRGLINNYIQELKSLNIEINVRFKAKLEIDKNGDITKIEIIESSGDIDKDNSIVEILKKWKFEESNRLTQFVIVELKYLLE